MHTVLRSQSSVYGHNWAAPWAKSLHTQNAFFYGHLGSDTKKRELAICSICTYVCSIMLTWSSSQRSCIFLKIWIILGFEANQIQEYFISQGNRLHNESNESVFRLSNLIVIRQKDGFVINKAFVDRAINDYDARIRGIDCSNVSALINVSVILSICISLIYIIY